MNIEVRSTMLKKIYGYYISFGIAAVARLKIPELIGDQQLSVTELSERSQTNEDALYRTMRLLASDGVFLETQAKVFQNTPLSKLLIEGAEGALVHLSQLHTSPLLQNSWQQLEYSLMTGKPATEEVFGTSFYDYLTKEKNQALRQTFDNAMSEIQNEDTSVIHDYFDFSKYHRIYDIGGGQGKLIRSIKEKYPSVSTALFERKVILEALDPVDFKAIELVPGDFFEAIPDDGDLYIMRHIIHNWNDVAANRILKNCIENTKKDAHILVLEMIVNEQDNTPDIVKYRDVNMLVCFSGGRQRSYSEFTSLFLMADLEISEVKPLPFGMNILLLRKIKK